MNVSRNVDVDASRQGAVPSSNEAPGAAGAVLRGWLVAGLVVGFVDGLRAWLSMRAIPPEQILANAPTGGLEFVLGTGAVVARWLVILAPVALIAGLFLRRRPTLASAAPLAAGLGVALAWMARLRWQSGIPVTSTPSLLLLAAGFALAALVALAFAPLLRRVPLRWLLLPALLVSVVGVGWRVTQSQRAAEPGSINARNEGLPNVLFVMVDALRHDALSAYGSARAITPNIDRLVESGAVFDHAFTQAPYTWTSFGSFFTGKYPRRHGLLKMEAGMRMPDNVTLASHLESGRLENGAVLEPDDVAAGAFLMGALSHGSGLSRGFDDICELMRGNDLIRSADLWSQFDAWTIGGTIRTKLKTRLEPDLHVETARRWIAEHADRRFFAFVHLYSTHTPYDPPEPFRSWYVDPSYDGPIESFWAEDRRTIERGEYTPTPADQQQVYDLYMGGVSKADHDIGILLDELAAHGVLEDTLVIVTSDHGEDFGEGGRWEHNHMYRSNLQVPLVLSWPNGFEGGVRVADLVESIDVFPTVMDAAGIQLPVVEDAFDVVDGHSLLPALRGGELAPRTHTFAEDSSLVSISTLEEMLVLDRYAVKPDGWQVALEEGLGTVRYHDLTSDPFQRRDLVANVLRNDASAPELKERVLDRVAALRAVLLAWNEKMPIDVEDVVRSDRDLETEANEAANRAALEAERKLLAELGYTESTFEYTGGSLRERVLELRAESDSQ